MSKQRKAKSVPVAAVFREITVLNNPALFTNDRLDSSQVPHGLHRYEVQRGKDGRPMKIAHSVLVNLCGTILMLEKIPMTFEGIVYIAADDIIFSGGIGCTAEDFIRKYPITSMHVPA